jgi:hypothetical protein
VKVSCLLYRLELKASAEALGFNDDIEIGESFLNADGTEMNSDEENEELSDEPQSPDVHVSNQEDSDAHMSDQESPDVRMSDQEDSDVHMSDQDNPVPSVEANESTQSRQKSRGTTSDWPWKTGLTAAGERIMAYRQHGKGFRCAVETEPGNPVFKIQSASSCGKLEVERYLQMEGIKQMTSPEERRKWTYKDRMRYKELNWLAVADYGTHNPFSKTGATRDPETWCFITSDSGFVDLMASDLRRVISPASADSAIRNLCEEHDATPPMDKTPEIVLTKPNKAEFHRYKQNRGLSPGGAGLKESPAAPNGSSHDSKPITTANEDIVALKSSVTSLTAAVEQIKTNFEQSQNSILEKIQQQQDLQTQMRQDFQRQQSVIEQMLSKLTSN